MTSVRAAIYLRISQDATGEGLGVARQLEDCRNLADGLGWTVADVYTDNDISATSGKARPDYQRMLRDITTGDIEAIVVWSPDRLYRRAADLETLIPVLEGRNVIVRTVKAGDIDLGSAYGRMIARILGAIATGEGEVKAERWKRSWRQGREAGRPAKTGSRLYGYTRDGQVIPEEAAVVQRMADSILAGDSITGHARKLQDEGIPGTRGGDWTPIAIKQYLLNPRIAGWSTLKGEIVAEGDWEPLIDRATWEELRALLNARTREAAPRVSLLNGLIFCGKCDTRLVTGRQRGKRSYRCANRPGIDGCGGLGGNAEPIEEIVETYARERLEDPDVLARIAQLQASPGSGHEELAQLELRVTELEQQLEQPGVPVATILRAIERAKDRQAVLMDEIAAAPRVAVPQMGTAWPEDLRRRRALIDLVVARVVLAPSTGGPKFNPERVKIADR